MFSLRYPGGSRVGFKQSSEKDDVGQFLALPLLPFWTVTKQRDGTANLINHLAPAILSQDPKDLINLLSDLKTPDSQSAMLYPDCLP